MATTGLSREALLEARKTGIGGSDAAAILGLSPWKTPVELYLEKTGQIEPEDLSDNPAVRAGIALEDVVAQYFAEDKDVKLRRRHQTLRHPQYPFLIAHLDREIVGWNAVLEVKTASAFFDREEWGPTGSDCVPPHYLVQVAHYMAVTGKKDGFLAVLFGGREFRWYHIPRDQELIDGLIDRERAFWECVEARTPPEIDFTAPRSLEAVKRLYPGTDGSTVQLSGGEVECAHNLLQQAKERKKNAEAQIDQAKAIILAAMGKAAIGEMPDGSRYVRSLRKVSGYTVEPKEYMDFRAQPAKGAEK